MFIASEVLLEELTKDIENHLIETKANWLRLNFMRIYQKSFQNNQFQNLQKWCNDFLVKYPNKIFDSEDFTSLQENALVSLIKRDDLQMEEIKIWKYIIKWGIAQIPDLSLLDGPENWTNDNFIALKNILKSCLPHVRYFQISGDDIVDHVQQFHQILDRNLWNDIMKRAVNPNRQISSKILPPRIKLTATLPTRTTESFSTIINEAHDTMEQFSTVINETHVAEIATWIDETTVPYTYANNPYSFKLLLRGTRDGFTSDAFWKICGEQANTIVVMKVKDTDEILGGYSPINWDKSVNGFINCDDSFIFSLKNGNINSSTLSRVKDTEFAVYCNPGRGPCFGQTDFDMFYDFEDDGCFYVQYSQCSYEKAIRDTEDFFSITEYEVFQIKRK
ncbi:hypothetical protein C2G38_131260 [Gigaspora rosea]|uniref:TLDc domain-containing protein n=1 Tax=Gigaspora rosea TaxID=44941 RepID=A0A397UPE1_9GLOM|nr:hypothetical protein C2G38_131260 [Gigaspora rosea]